MDSIQRPDCTAHRTYWNEAALRPCSRCAPVLQGGPTGEGPVDEREPPARPARLPRAWKANVCAAPRRGGRGSRQACRESVRVRTVLGNCPDERPWLCGESRTLKATGPPARATDAGAEDEEGRMGEGEARRSRRSTGMRKDDDA